MSHIALHARCSAAHVRTVLISLAAAFLLMSPTGAFAQTDLATENEELKAKVTQLETQRDALAKRVTELNNEVMRLRNELAKHQKPASPSGAPGTPGTPRAPGTTGSPGSPGTTPGAPATNPTADATQPFQSPDALFANLHRQYQEKFGSMSRDSRTEQMRYQREVATWTRTVQRELRGPVDWTITLLEPRAAADRPGRLVFQVIDPATGKPISEPALALLPSRWTRDIAAASVGDKWKVTATFSATPSFNAQRENAASPDEPRLIGPYAEFGFDLAITKLEPAP